jgi:hypothetical protein
MRVLVSFNTSGVVTVLPESAVAFFPLVIFVPGVAGD